MDMSHERSFSNFFRLWFRFLDFNSALYTFFPRQNLDIKTHKTRAFGLNFLFWLLFGFLHRHSAAYTIRTPISIKICILLFSRVCFSSVEASDVSIEPSSDGQGPARSSIFSSGLRKQSIVCVLTPNAFATIKHSKNVRHEAIYSKVVRCEIEVPRLRRCETKPQKCHRKRFFPPVECPKPMTT